MARPAKQPEHPPARSGAAEYRQHAWTSLTAERACKTHGMLASSPDDSSSMNIWEARAFAEDTSSLAAGIWPPRAYPCSFCHREFRSAQALGGHMNVHRRDRARLRQASPPPPPFCAPQTMSLQPTPPTLLNPKFQLSSTVPCLDIHPIEIPSKAKPVPPTALPFAATSPKSTNVTLAARYPSHNAAPFPLRLDLLASEAASTFMLSETEARNQLSLWPAASALDLEYGCRSAAAIDSHSEMGRTANNSCWSVPSSSSANSSSLLTIKAESPLSPSMGSTIPCKRAKHVDLQLLVHLEDESPRKKCSVATNSEYTPYVNQEMSLKNCSKDDGTIIRSETSAIHEASNKNKSTSAYVHESMCSMPRGRGKGGEYCVDLELRLGQGSSSNSPAAAEFRTSASTTSGLWSQA